MNHVDEQLTLFSRDRKYHPSIHAAVLLAKKTLNHYYGLTDSSEVYRIAMGMLLFILIISDLTSSITVLHPCHKLTYFKNAGWELEWINTAETLVREEFERCRADSAIECILMLDYLPYYCLPLPSLTLTLAYVGFCSLLSKSFQCWYFTLTSGVTELSLSLSFPSFLVSGSLPGPPEAPGSNAPHLR